MALVHHELCFGCGRANVFGLLIEAELAGQGALTGRAFIKQDHQGALRGSAHDGVIVAALSEAMSLACGEDMVATALDARLEAPVPVGVFLELEAQVLDQPDGGFDAAATATFEDRPVASARGSYERR